MITKLGFTGTQDGMTPCQIARVSQFLADYEIKEVHHGDCVGADNQFNFLCRAFKIFIVIHPPSNATKRAFCGGYGQIRAPQEYLVRNHDIVRESECLLAAPKTEEEALRSGTWATVRFARKLHRPVVIVRPSGEVLMENWPWGEIEERS